MLQIAEKSGAIKHLKKSHKDVYNCITMNKNKKTVETSFPEIYKIRVTVNPKEIFHACVELITVNAIPISLVDSPAFKKLLKPYVLALELKGIKLVINRKNILKYIAKKADEIRDLIKSKVKNKCLCLMADIGSRYNRSILGVNVAYMKNSKSCIHTIGMHPLRKSHTSENIRDTIKSNLSDYNLSLNQIFSITTDNGANLLKATALLDEDVQKQKVGEAENPENIIQHDSDINEIDMDSDFETENDVFDEQYFIDLLHDVRKKFSTLTYSDLIQGNYLMTK